MRIYFFITLVVLVFTGIISCKKDTTAPYKNYGTVYASPDVKDYTFFKTGSYWIYKDSVTGMLDSVYVVAVDAGMKEVTTDMKLGFTGNFEYYSVKMKSSLDTFYYYNGFAAYYIIYGGSQPVYRVKTGPTKGIGNTIMLTREFVNGTTFGNSNGSKVVIEGNFAALQCGDSTFSEVREMFCNKDITENNDSTYFFHSRKKGIVKKLLKTQNKNWNLVRWNIVQ